MVAAVLNNFASLGVPDAPQAKPKDRLQQADFLKLMTTQLANQDPFKPLTSGDFMTQLAQFSSVQGIQDLQKSFTSFADAMIPSQSLQSASLVGHKVLVPAPGGMLTDQGLSGAFELPAGASDVSVKIHNAAGELVKDFSLGAKDTGVGRYKWDGTSNTGAPMPPGPYQVDVTAMIGGKSLAVDNLAEATVDSVVLGTPGQEARVNLAGLGQVNFSSLREIR
ncbi:MAG: flagellar hook assembly protein FlgD [Porticoccaceae bacterium]